MYCRPAQGLPLAALGLPVASPLDPVAARVIVVDCMEVVQLVVLSLAVMKHLSLSSHRLVEKAPPSFTGD